MNLAAQMGCTETDTCLIPFRRGSPEFRAAEFIETYARRVPSNPDDLADFKRYGWSSPLIFENVGNSAVVEVDDFGGIRRRIILHSACKPAPWSLGGEEGELPGWTDELRGLLDRATRWRAESRRSSPPRTRVKSNPPAPVAPRPSTEVKKGGRPRVGEGKKDGQAEQLKKNIYDIIRGRKRPRAGAQTLLRELKADRQFSEQVKGAGLKLDRKLIRNALRAGQGQHSDHETRSRNVS
jgi:hypothetical protein